MPIEKGPVEIWTAAGDRVGAGFGYLHLSGHPLRPVSGSVTKMTWTMGLAQPGQHYQIRQAGGRVLTVRCTKCVAACGPAVFKYSVVEESTRAD